MAAVDVAATAICTRKPGIGRRAAQLFADRSRLANEAAEPADVERDRAVTMRLDARRKIARELDERV